MLILAFKGRKANISIIFTRSFFEWADVEQISEQQALQKKCWSQELIMRLPYKPLYHHNGTAYP